MGWGLRTRIATAGRIVRNLTLDPLAGLMPRSPRRWVFGYTGGAFADNPRALFLWMRLNRPDIDARWISSSRRTAALVRRTGHPAHWRWSPQGLFAAMRARVWIFGHGIDNIHPGLSRGALLVNLWHGVGLKTVHLGHAGGNTAAAARAAAGRWGRLLGIEYLRPYDMLVTTSPAMQAHFARQFALAERCCPQIGYSRLDFAEDPTLSAATLAIDAAQGFRWPAEFRETYIYLPTFRDTGRPFFTEAIPDARRLSAALAARNALLWIKPHPRTVLDAGALPDNIRIWPTDIDINGWLSRIDGLITDYSSVLYDWLRTRSTGVILYTFDLARYLAQDRALTMPFDANVTGLRIDTFADLCAAIRDGTALSTSFAAEAQRLDTVFWGGSSRPASPAIAAAIATLANPAQKAVAPSHGR